MESTYHPRPAILAGPALVRGHAVIEASAGTGKTFTLEHLVLDLIINGEAGIEEILIVTFTEAAARELRERVRTLIRKIHDSSETEKPGGSETCSWKVNEATRSRLREALFRFDGASISTIHGFCRRILSEQAFLGGRLFDQVHADGAELFGFSFREEARIALAESGPVGEELRAWIGDGFTLPALEEFLYRCHREGCPDRCLLTPLWDPRGLLEAAGLVPGSRELLSALKTLYTQSQSAKALENLINELQEAVEAMRKAPVPREAAAAFMGWARKVRTLDKVKAGQIDTVLRLAGQPEAPKILRELAVTLEKMAGRAAPVESFFAYRLLPRIQARLSSRKKALGLIDYDDMLLGVLEALSGRESSLLLNTLRQRWKYALVDEFQDTDPVQWEIFRRIFVDGPGNHRLLVIGDPKQAIYGFRGADVHTYDRARQYLTAEQAAARVPLTLNYRSTAPLIEAVNAILTVSDGEGKSFFSGLNRYPDPVKCGDPSRSAWQAGRPSPPVTLICLNSEGEKLNAALIRQKVAAYIAAEISRLTGGEAPLITGSSEKKPGPINYSDIYILTRTAGEGKQIGQVLRSYSIPHAFYKQEGLFQTDEADHVYRLLQAIDMPAEPALRMSAWLTPFFGVPLSELPDWREGGESHPLVSLLQGWNRLACNRAWPKLFDEILTASGLIRRLIFRGDERALTNYQHLFELLLAEAHARPLTLGELARVLKARIDGRKPPEGREGDIQRLETDRDAVQILTMHKAKGLEAEVVFVGGGFSDPGGGSPQMQVYHQNGRRCLHLGRAAGSIASAVEKEKREEDQRLLYVALTRARSKLYLPYFGMAAGSSGNGKNLYSSRLPGNFYSILQKQLDLLQAAGRLDNSSYFVLQNAPGRQKPGGGKSRAAAPEEWPPEELLSPLPSNTARAELLKPGHRGVLLTSYTRMSRGRTWRRPDIDPEDSRTAGRGEEVTGEAAAAGSGEELYSPGSLYDQRESAPGTEDGQNGQEELPGGKEMGIFLHTLLENALFSSLSKHDFQEWSNLPATREQALTEAGKHGLSEQLIPAALKLVYRALRTPIRLPGREKNTLLNMPGGIASSERHCKEMAFIYPIPETIHPLCAMAERPREEEREPPFKVVRGYLQGLIDLVFEQEGKYYLLDWKSDRLPAYDRESLENHVSANYNLQARIYTLAFIRQIGIANKIRFEKQFGGIIYLFIRGISAGGDNGENEGAWFSRPSWHDILSWELEMINRKDWGGDVIEIGSCST